MDSVPCVYGLGGGLVILWLGWQRGVSYVGWLGTGGSTLRLRELGGVPCVGVLGGGVPVLGIGWWGSIPCGSGLGGGFQFLGLDGCGTVLCIGQLWRGAPSLRLGGSGGIPCIGLNPWDHRVGQHPLRWLAWHRGARSLGLDGEAASPVLVSLVEGSLASSLEDGAVSPVLMGLAEGYQPSGS